MRRNVHVGDMPGPGDCPVCGEGKISIREALHKPWFGPERKIFIRVACRGCDFGKTYCGEWKLNGEGWTWPVALEWCLTELKRVYLVERQRRAEATSAKVAITMGVTDGTK